MEGKGIVLEEDFGQPTLPLAQQLGADIHLLAGSAAYKYHVCNA